MKRLVTIAGIFLISACGPPDDAVRIAEDAARIAHDKCDEKGSVNAWSAERRGDIWVARLGSPDTSGCWQFTAQIKASDGSASCQVTLCNFGGR